MMFRRTSLTISILAVAALCGTINAQAQGRQAPFWSTPTIHGYGRIHFLPKAAYQPRATATYKVVFAVSQAASKPSEVNPGLDHVARTVNLYVAAGVPLSHLKFVAIVYGPATPIVLDATRYRAAFGVPNPNLDLIAKLRRAGVDVTVCGQAVPEHHFQYPWVSRSVTLSLSSLVTVTMLQNEGYALMQM